MSFSSVTGKVWKLKEFDSTDIVKFCENYSLSEIVAKLLSIRKKDIENVELFLNPKIKNYLPNPLLLKDMTNAVNRSYKSILNNDLIGIFGDYDVDGATSTAILANYFTDIKKNIEIYIPDRQTEGYGPTIESFKKIIKKGAKIIFTVDCGTSSYDPILEAQKLNTDIIVIDHHQSSIELPKACAIVNPNRFDDVSGLNYLCAAGVCFVFLVALNKKLRDEKWFEINNIKEPNILNYLDLVSLGTVCDVVPLIGLNRAIVKQGLLVLKKRSNLGLKTLYDLCKIESNPTTYDLGFKLGPRINAGGRMGKSSHGAELLISKDPQRTYKIAKSLDESNKERQSIEALLTEKINIEVKKLSNQPVIILSGNSWHEGIIGIVASKIKEKHNKPTILISVKDGIGKGSARSINGFNIGSEIIKGVQNNILEKGGGHKMAGGFTIKEKNISKLKDFLFNSFIKSKAYKKEQSIIYIDSIIAPSAVNEEFFYEVNSLAPFGSGNNEPKFVLEELKIISSNKIKNSHISLLMLGRDGSKFRAFAWNSISTPLEEFLSVKNKKKFNIAGKMRLNEWRGKKNIHFIIEDISLS